MREHFLALVDESLGAVDADPRRLLDALRRAAEQVRAGRNPLDDGGLVTLLASPEQHAVLQRLQGLMSLLEGHGDVTMDRAGRAYVPSADRFARVLRQRRQSSGLTKVVQKLTGIEAKLLQYEQGERFIEAIEREGGPALLETVWRGSEWLPSLPEIRRPELWLDRVQTAEAAHN
jgi:putative hydrolase